MKLSYKIQAAVLGVAATIALVQPQIAVGLSGREVGEIAQEITVRIDGPGKGSGTIVDKQGDSYIVLTNCHVIETSGTYTIQTHAGSSYTVKANQEMCQPGEVDLAVLRFTSDRRYRVANLGDSSQLVVGDKVYVSGWKADPGQYNRERGYRFSDGIIAGIDSNARKGYTLVLTNDSTKGMSGGPILDEQGNVVGINGLAIINFPSRTPEFFGIAINTYKRWKEAGLPPEEEVNKIAPEIVGKIAQEFTVRIDGPENGSGTIVGKRGDTYTVLTNCHVIETPGTYTIITHAGRRYRVNANQDMCQPGGIDLAVLRFTSTRRYRVANLGDSSQLVVGRKIYVSGWVSTIGPSQRREREYRFRDGNIASTESKTGEGYSLVHTSILMPGMSGGPILDEQGDVVGINGLARRHPLVGATEFLGIAINTYKSW